MSKGEKTMHKIGAFLYKIESFLYNWWRHILFMVILIGSASVALYFTLLEGKGLIAIIGAAISCFLFFVGSYLHRCYWTYMYREILKMDYEASTLEKCIKKIKESRQRKFGKKD
jgi:uncharacterized BrkB/YihY/UPF0761 family membrane protein